MSLKIAIFWGVEPCSLVYLYRRFRSMYCLKEYQTTRHHIPKDSRCIYEYYARNKVERLLDSETLFVFSHENEWCHIRKITL
jgi:hypothetical protein